MNLRSVRDDLTVQFATLFFRQKQANREKREKNNTAGKAQARVSDADRDARGMVASISTGITIAAPDGPS